MMVLAWILVGLTGGSAWAGSLPIYCQNPPQTSAGGCIATATSALNQLGCTQVRVDRAQLCNLLPSASGSRASYAQPGVWSCSLQSDNCSLAQVVEQTLPLPKLACPLGQKLVERVKYVKFGGLCIESKPSKSHKRLGPAATSIVRASEQAD